MGRLAALLVITLLGFLLAVGGPAREVLAGSVQVGTGGPVVGAAAAPALQAGQQQVVSTASVSIQVASVREATNDVRAMAERMGGSVQQLSSSGAPEPDQATITIRVPQAEFARALENIRGMGHPQTWNIEAEDVSERLVDLESRLRSSLREEQSFLTLLERAESASGVLAIERELPRIRSEIDQLQIQLNALKRRVEFATIIVSLAPGAAEAADGDASADGGNGFFSSALALGLAVPVGLVALGVLGVSLYSLFRQLKQRRAMRPPRL